MARKTNRRDFLQTSAAVGAGFWVAGGVQAKASRMAIEKIRFGCIGIGGKGESDTADAAKHGDIVAICDIDESRLDAAGKKYNGAKKFFDFRLMLEKMENQIDAVTVSTPDHTHAPAALLAMSMGKHCFCQKPMTHSLSETRKMGDLARAKNLATQMGNQGTSNDGLRKCAAMIKAGQIGTVKEVHVWTNRPIWPQGGKRPDPEACPAHVKWDLWLGPAAYRPYAKGYHPFSWRGFWDFGTGALGDMACHTMNMPYSALDMRDPVSVQAETAGHDKDYYPKWSKIRYEFAERNGRPAFTMFWYDGGKLPDASLLPGKKLSDSGSLLVGDAGKLYAPGDYAENGGELIDGHKKDVEFEKSPGHFVEFAQAVKGGPEAKSNFPNYATGLTETVLLGNLAVYAASAPGQGPKVNWNAVGQTATIEASDLDGLIRHTYRAGYEL